LFCSTGSPDIYFSRFRGCLKTHLSRSLFYSFANYDFETVFSQLPKVAKLIEKLRNVVVKKETIKQFIDPQNAIAEEIKVEDYDRFVRPIDNYRQSLMVNQLSK